MNFKILSITIVVAASLAALASIPITATPAYAGGNVHFHQNNNKAGSVDTTCTFENSCDLGDCSTVSGTVSDSCNTVTGGGGSGGGGGDTNFCTNPANDKPTGCTPRP